MTDQSRIYVDLLKTDGRRRIRLSTVGTREDLERLEIVLVDGMTLRLYSDDLDAKGDRDDLVVDGVACLDESSQTWVAEIDWDAIRHESEL